MCRYFFTIFISCILGIHSLFAQSKNIAAEVIDLLHDPRFNNGFSIQNPEPGKIKIDSIIYPFGKSTEKPSWRIVQWASQYNISGTPVKQIDDTVIYQNKGKKLSFIRKNNSRSVSLEIYGSKEYQQPRKAGESWPHLLLEQQCRQIKLYLADQIWYTLDAKLLFDERKMNADAFNPDLHTSQITLYLQIQNTNTKSPGHADFFWFGLPLYDHRYESIETYAAQDLGKDDATQKFIYCVASAVLFQESMHRKNWIGIHKNIYPEITAAIQLAKEKGYLSNSGIEDLSIVSLNLGWEIPGTFDCGILLRDLSLKAIKR
jgi:hypothetical protein